MKIDIIKNNIFNNKGFIRILTEANVLVDTTTDYSIIDSLIGYYNWIAVDGLLSSKQKIDLSSGSAKIEEIKVNHNNNEYTIYILD